MDEAPGCATSPSHAPAVDGLRACAVAALLCGVLAGNGFLGVPAASSFLLVLCGYVVTAQMAGESRSDGRLDLVSMWRRRAVRWVPVLWILLALVALGSVAGVWPEFQVAALPGETLAALTNMSNWWRLSSPAELADGVSCPLSHLWLTSVVEQAVVGWSALFAAAFLLHRRGWTAAVPAALAMTGAASAWSYLRAGGDVPAATLGTGVRLGEFAMGATLAWTWRRRGLRGPRVPGLRLLVLRAWPVGLVVLLALGPVGARSSFWANGGFLLTGAAATAVVAGGVTTGALRTFLEMPLLAWVGQRAGAAYLVAWPAYLAAPSAWGPVGRTAVTLGVVVLAMWAVDRLPTSGRSVEVDLHGRRPDAGALGSSHA